MKKFYCLSGLPRAGNTILSSVLNQNKNIAVSANSVISETLYKLESFKETDSALLNFPDHKSYNSMMRGIIPSYYSEWPQDYIIDRSAWGTPDNFKLLQDYCPNEIKIISLVRDVAEVFSSFINWSENNPNNFIDQNCKTIEEKYDYLMNPYGNIIRSVLSAKTLIETDPENKYHIIVDYNEFISSPQEELDRIYQFLDIPHHKHDLKNLKQFKVNGTTYEDDIFGRNLHKIRTNNISKRNYRVDIPDHILDRCREFNFWDITV